MTQAKTGDTVKVHYTGKLDDGRVFDTSEGREPLQFKLGTHQVITGFEAAVEGMAPGDKKTVHIPVEEAYGKHDSSLVVEVPRQQLPPDLDPSVGDQLQMTHRSGRPVIVTVTAADEENITLDANHPLAGEDLTFDIELVEIS